MNNTNVVIMGKLAPPQKPKSPFSELVADDTQGLSAKEFDAKIQAYREARQQRMSAGRRQQ